MTREERMAVAKEGWPPCGQVVTITRVGPANVVLVVNSSSVADTSVC